MDNANANSQNSSIHSIQSERKELIRQKKEKMMQIREKHKLNQFIDNYQLLNTSNGSQLDSDHDTSQMNRRIARQGSANTQSDSSSNKSVESIIRKPFLPSIWKPNASKPVNQNTLKIQALEEIRINASVLSDSSSDYYPFELTLKQSKSITNNELQSYYNLLEKKEKTRVLTNTNAYYWYYKRDFNEVQLTKFNSSNALPTLLNDIKTLRDHDAGSASGSSMSTKSTDKIKRKTKAEKEKEAKLLNEIKKSHKPSIKDKDHSNNNSQNNNNKLKDDKRKLKQFKHVNLLPKLQQKPKMSTLSSAQLRRLSVSEKFIKDAKEMVYQKESKSLFPKMVYPYVIKAKA